MKPAADNRLTGAEAFVRMLQAHGVRHVFGLCGDTSLPLYDAFARLDHGITHILTRDERSAAYMADVYARVSGRVGVCEAPSGGGATYTVPGVVEANESSVPVLAVTTDISVSGRGRYTLTELDQEALFRPLAKFSRVLDRADQIPATVRRAFREMTTGRSGAAHVGLPYDVQRAPVDESEVWADPTLGAYPARRTAPDAGSLAAAAAAILASERPLIVAGGGPILAGAEAELAALAERIGAPVAMSVSGHGSLADDHALALGVVGSNGGTEQTRRVLDRADLVIFVGCRAGSVTTEKWRHPAPGKVKVVHVDVDPAAIGANYPTAAAVVGDAKLALAALAAEIGAGRRKRGRDGWGTRAVAAAKAEKQAAFAALAGSSERPIRPERVVAALQAALAPDSIVVADAGTPCPYLSAYFRLARAGRTLVTNRAHGALGYSLPGVVGAHYGRPRAKCVAVMGDGSFGIAAGELETLVRLRLPVALVVISNAGYGWIKAGQKSGYGGRYFGVDFTPTDHARVAQAYGLAARRVEDPEALAPALAEAVAADRPFLVDVVTQPLHEARAPVSEWVA